MNCYTKYIEYKLGLFNKAIIQSGNIFVPWAKEEFDPKDMAKDLGKMLGFIGEDRQKLVEFLRQQPIERLGDAYADMTANLHEVSLIGCDFPSYHVADNVEFEIRFQMHPANFCPGPFSPCIEDIKEGAFLPDSPAELVKNTAPLPIIYGVTDKEGYLFVGSGYFYESYSKLNTI